MALKATLTYSRHECLKKKAAVIILPSQQGLILKRTSASFTKRRTMEQTMRLSSRIFSSVSARSFFVGLIVVMAVSAFAFTGVGTVGGLDVNTAANIGNQKVTMRQFQEAFQQVSRQNQPSQDENDAKRMENVQTALNQLIEQKVVVEEAVRLGWDANDLEVADWIRKIPAFQNKDTKKFDIELYTKFMKTGQFTELELYRQGRDSISTNKYYALLGLGEVVPEALREEQSKRNNEEFQMEYALVAPNAAETKAAAQEQAKAYVADEKNKKELEKSYEDSKAEFSRKAQVQARGILIGWKEATRAQGDALTRTQAQAQALVNEISAKIKAGKDFSTLASEQNDDPNAKAKLGDMGWLDDSNIDPETAKAAFALTEQAPISDVLTTPFGFRILQRVAARPALERSFDDVKLELAERKISPGVRQQKQIALEGEVSKALQEGDKAKLEELLKANSISWQKAAQPITASSQFVEEFGNAAGILKHLFLLKNEGDLVKELVNASGSKRVVRLLSRKTKEKAPEADPASKEKAERLQARTENFKLTQSFATKTQKKIVEIYERDKEIKRNDGLFASLAR